MYIDIANALHWVLGIGVDKTHKNLYGSRMGDRILEVVTKAMPVSLETMGTEMSQFEIAARLRSITDEAILAFLSKPYIKSSPKRLSRSFARRTGFRLNE